MKWLGTVSAGAMEHLGYCDNSRPACFLDVTMCKVCKLQDEMFYCVKAQESQWIDPVSWLAPTV